MSSINDPRVVNWANTKLRPLMDAAYTFLASCADEKAYFDQNIAPLLGADQSAILVDGASVNGVDATGGDGRQILSVSDLQAIATYIMAGMANFWINGTLSAGADNSAYRSLVIKSQVNGRPLL